MSSLDQKYIADLVRRAILGESNAFAELYAATFQEQYRFSYLYLKDRYLAREALQETYIRALQNMDSLRDPKLFLPWLSFLSYQSVLNLRLERTTPYRFEDVTVRIGSRDYVIRQLLTLPFTEAEVLMMRYFDHMPIDRIANLLNLRKTAVIRYLKRGERRLSAILHD